MANKKIIELDTASQVNSDAVFPLSQLVDSNQKTLKATVAQMQAAMLAPISGLVTLGESSGSIASFSTDIADKLFSCYVNVTAVQAGSGTPAPDNVRAISGWSACDLSVNSIITTISFGSTVYGGVLDVLSGVLTVTHEYYAITGTENWAWAKSSTYSGGFYTPVASVGGKANTPFICSQAKTVTSIAEYVNGTCYCDGSLNFRIMSAEDTVTDWTNYLANQYTNGTPVAIRYEIATPTVIQLTPTEVKTILGQNNIFADCGDIDLKYLETIGNRL